MKPLNATLSQSGTTIFEAMSALARVHDAVNLGQGFPDEAGPQEMLVAAADATLSGPHQYPPMMGTAALRQAVAAHEKRFYDLEINWQTEVLITSGATEALLDCFMAVLNAGDEVILLEPAYDTYAPVIRRLGAHPVPVRLQAPRWELPVQELAKAFSARTKALVLNSPLNPIGKVFGPEELEAIAELVIRHDAVAICDEVYEHLTFDGTEHIPLMTLPGMRERTVRIGSAGKTFSVTGWKVGYVVGPAPLIGPIAKAHQFSTFTTPPSLQHAVAIGMASSDDYYSGLAARMARSRDRLRDGLNSVGITPLACNGTYFFVADLSAWMQPEEDAVAFCRRLVLEAGVVLIPMSAFYESDPPRALVRFCFSKNDATIDAAIERLGAWVRAQSQ